MQRDDFKKMSLGNTVGYERNGLLNSINGISIDIKTRLVYRTESSVFESLKLWLSKYDKDVYNKFFNTLNLKIKDDE